MLTQKYWSPKPNYIQFEYVSQSFTTQKKSGMKCETRWVRHFPRDSEGKGILGRYGMLSIGGGDFVIENWSTTPTPE